MLTTSRIVALLLVATVVILVVGVRKGGGSAGIRRPSWFPPIWLRAALPLAVAGGLWYGQQWAWWAAVVMCLGFLVWSGIAGLMVALGGFFAGAGATFRVAHFSLLVGIWLTALALLLSA